MGEIIIAIFCILIGLAGLTENKMKQLKLYLLL